MNIFALSRCPKESAQQMLNKHVVKMPTETCQMLHTNELCNEFTDKFGYEPTLAQLKQYHSDSGSILMKPAMLNHPSTIWARQNNNNALWLFQHGVELCREYNSRYNKEHGSFERILQTAIDYDADASEATPVSIAMLDVYRLDKEDYFKNNPNNDEWDFVIDSYKHYYLEGKWKFAEWPQGQMPKWWPSNHFAVKYNVGVRAYNSTNPKYPQTLLKEA